MIFPLLVGAAYANEAIVDHELLPVVRDALGTGAEDSLSRSRLAAAEDKA
jgi:hypothetical protein